MFIVACPINLKIRYLKGDNQKPQILDSCASCRHNSWECANIIVSRVTNVDTEDYSDYLCCNKIIWTPQVFPVSLQSAMMTCAGASSLHPASSLQMTILIRLGWHHVICIVTLSHWCHYNGGNIGSPPLPEDYWHDLGKPEAVILPVIYLI